MKQQHSFIFLMTHKQGKSDGRGEVCLQALFEYSLPTKNHQAEIQVAEYPFELWPPINFHANGD